MSVQNGEYTRTNSFGADGGRIIPRFYVNSVQDPIATQREGRPIFFDREEVELITPGNPYNIPVEVVNDSHRQRWPEQYKAFKAGNEMSTTGTPLEQWPILKPAQVRELKALNLFTVEHVRDMSDHTIQRIPMGGRRLKAQAEAYLDDAEHQALLSKTIADNEKKDQRISELESKVTELGTLLNNIHGQMQAMKDAPSPVATFVPGMADPAQQFAQAQAQPGAASSLDNLPEPARRRPGRPRKDAAAA